LTCAMHSLYLLLLKYTVCRKRFPTNNIQLIYIFLQRNGIIAIRFLWILENTSNIFFFYVFLKINLVVFHFFSFRIMIFQPFSIYKISYGQKCFMFFEIFMPNFVW
jgi:hypothetical protein